MTFSKIEKLKSRKTTAKNKKGAFLKGKFLRLSSSASALRPLPSNLEKTSPDLIILGHALKCKNLYRIGPRSEGGGLTKREVFTFYFPLGMPIKNRPILKSPEKVFQIFAYSVILQIIIRDHHSQYKN